MKSTEFRLGNYILLRGNLCQIVVISGLISESVSAVMIDKHGEKRHLYGEMQDIEGNELTEEWLLKFGFTKSFAVNNFAIQTEAGVLDLTPSENIGCHTYIEDNWIRTIESVHELQNLYHAITGKELTLKSE
jgi:hypothetical protein